MKVVLLSGGVGGARLARGLAVVDGIDLTIVVNVGDDLPTHGLYVSPDLDTMVYTLAGMEGPEGWGRSGDTFRVNTELARFGLDNRFRLGDLDLALKIFRTHRLGKGDPLSRITEEIGAAFGIGTRVIPATDDPLRTVVHTRERLELSFQTYFVERGHQDRIARLEFRGADDARPAPGVVDALSAADAVLIGPSNPPLSIWPILAVGAIAELVREHPNVIAVSPLVGGKTLKGPADAVMADLGLGHGTAAVLESYRGLLGRLVVDTMDAGDQGTRDGVSVEAMETVIPTVEASERLARAILGG